MPVAIFVAAVLIYAAVAAQDLRERRVSNFFCAGIAGLGVVRWAVLMQIAPAAWAMVAAVLLFGIGIVMFSRGWLGGGDVKLISATGLLIGGSDTPAFLLLMSVIGSVLALVILIQVWLGRFFAARAESEAVGPSVAAEGAADRFKVPYGMAVALAASVVVIVQTYFPLHRM